MVSEKKKEMKEELPEELHDIFDAFAEQYKAHSERVHGRAFVSYEVLAGLIKDGWRPSAAPLEE